MTGDAGPAAITQTRRWVERFVIGLDLCPFAAAPHRAGRILYLACDATELDAIYRRFLDILQGFVMADPQSQETAFMILTRGLATFDDYLDALGLMDQAIVEAGLEGVIQVASFHPRYRFGHAAPDDPANHSNRSPYPMFHLIREDSLTQALAACLRPEDIPRRNVRRLRAMGVAGIRALLDDVQRGTDGG